MLTRSFRQFVLILLAQIVVFFSSFSQAFSQQGFGFTVKSIAESQALQTPPGSTGDMREFLSKSEWIFGRDGSVTLLREFPRDRPVKLGSVYYGRYYTQEQTIVFSGCNIDPDCRKIGDIASGYYSRFEGKVDLSGTQPVMTIDWIDFRQDRVTGHYRMRLILQ